MYLVIEKSKFGGIEVKNFLFKTSAMESFDAKVNLDMSEVVHLVALNDMKGFCFTIDEDGDIEVENGVIVKSLSNGRIIDGNGNIIKNNL